MYKSNDQEIENPGFIKTDRIKPLTGILGVGHKTYWAEFEGLLDELMEKQRIFIDMVQKTNVVAINFGMSDCAETAYERTRGFFKPEVRTYFKRWFSEGLTHHFALGIGHKTGVIKKISDFLSVDSVIIDQS